MIYQNLGQFLKENSQKYKERVVYEIKRGFRTERFTFREVYELSLKTASFLQQKGVKKSDRVAIWAPNMPEYPILYFGCWLAGAVAVPIDLRTTQETIKVFLTKARCKLGFKSKFIPGGFAAEGEPRQGRGKLVEESFYLEDLVNLVKDLSATHHSSLLTHNSLAEIAFTSGTTGTPKGVMLTHGNFLSDVEALTSAFPFKKDYRALSLLPLSHAFEQVVDFLALFSKGCRVTYLERTNRLTILKALRKNKITSVALVPQALQLLMNGIEQEVENQGKQKIWSILNSIAAVLPIFARRLLFHQVIQKLGGSLKFFGCGSAPLNLKLAQKWENLGIEVFEGYGATEEAAALTINTPQSKKLGSVGKVLPGMQVRINQGEIVAHGPNISPGYFEDEEKTKAAFYDGWYKTGDVGQFDKDGFLYITGRESFRIVLPDGRKVYPEDLEKKLNAHPQVLESCVVGVKKEQGEVVHAVIITAYPQKLDNIIKDINLKLASHEQILEASLWKEEDFPRTPILKIDRRKVLEVVAGEEKEEGVESVKSEDKLLNLIAQVTKAAPAKIKEASSLATDLRLDSLGRVELLSLIEQEFAVAISETKINPQTTVGDLRELIKVSPATPEEIPLNQANYSSLSFLARVWMQNLVAFPVHSIFVPLEVTGKDHLKNIELPAIFYFNHIGILDGLLVLRVLPQSIRRKLVIAVDSKIWQDYRRFWVEAWGAGFPFDKDKKIKASLDLLGEFLDQGFSVLMAPEGEFTPNGKVLSFKPGAGFMAVSMEVPVIPIKIDPAYREIFPTMGGRLMENLPKKRKKVWIKIGQPLAFPKGTSHDEATTKMQEALEKL